MFQTLQSRKKLNDLNVGSGHQDDVSLPTIIALFGPGNWFIIRGLLETEQPRQTQLNRPSLTLACRSFRFLKSKQHRIIQTAFKKPGEPLEYHSVCGREKKQTVSCHFQRWRAGHRYFPHITEGWSAPSSSSSSSSCCQRRTCAVVLQRVTSTYPGWSDSISPSCKNPKL